jgi:hypothetical protein
MYHLKMPLRCDFSLANYSKSKGRMPDAMIEHHRTRPFLKLPILS